MESKGKLIEFKMHRVTFELEYFDPASVGDLMDKPLRITAEAWRDKRSHNANSYLWVLLQKIAEKVHSDKWTIYLDMLQRYSRSFTHIIVKPQAVEAVMEMYRTAIDLGEIMVDGETGHQLQVYFGSSTFDTKEMQVLLDGVVSECKELGIETMQPEEIARIVSEWDRKEKK